MGTPQATACPPRAVSVPEAGKLLGVCRNTAWAMVWRGDLRSVRLGRRRVVPLREIDRILAHATRA